MSATTTNRPTLAAIHEAVSFRQGCLNPFA